MQSTEGSAVYNFQYANPTRICFGEGQIARLPELIPAGSRLLVLYGAAASSRTGSMSS
jgi:NADP-dependent alcohol dehydrogenase